MYDEAGKLAMLLVGALHLYQKKGTKNFAILPQARLMRETTDYAIVVAEVSFCWNCTLVDIHLPLYFCISKNEHEVHHPLRG